VVGLVEGVVVEGVDKDGDCEGLEFFEFAAERAVCLGAFVDLVDEAGGADCWTRLGVVGGVQAGGAAVHLFRAGNVELVVFVLGAAAGGVGGGGREGGFSAGVD